MPKDIIVFDFETSGRNPNTCQPTQLAAIALDGRTLKKKGEFNSYMRTLFDGEEVEAGYAPVEEGALKVTRNPGETREDQIQKLATAPEQEGVWTKFVSFVGKYTWQGKPFFAPIPAGFNIINYDMPIVNRLCQKYGQWNDSRGQQTVFDPIRKIDVMDNVYMWTENDPDIKSISMDSLRERMGMETSMAHDALQDVKDTANIMIKFMRTHRAVARNLKMDTSFATGMEID